MGIYWFPWKNGVAGVKDKIRAAAGDMADAVLSVQIRLWEEM